MPRAHLTEMSIMLRLGERMALFFVAYGISSFLSFARARVCVCRFEGPEGLPGQVFSDELSR